MKRTKKQVKPSKEVKTEEIKEKIVITITRGKFYVYF